MATNLRLMAAAASAAVGLLSLASAVGAAPAGEQPVDSFESRADIAWLRASNTKLTLVGDGVTEGSQAMRVEFRQAQWPNVYFGPKKPWDWKAPCRLTLDILNPGKEAVRFFMRIDDDPSADGVNHCRTGSGAIGPGKAGTFSMAVSGTAMDMGMRGLPPPPVGTDIGSGGSGAFDPSHVTAFQLFMSSPKTATALIIDNVRIVPDAPPQGIVDEFGQYAGGDWPGKLKSTAELALRAAAEKADLAALPRLPDRDRFGGWLAGPKLKATGHFRTEMVDGKWWFVDPDGRLFVSLGVDCVGYEASTFTTGREQLFTWLPKPGEPLWEHLGYADTVHSGPIKAGDTFNFLSANLERKYGPNYRDVALETARQRLASWGFNTLGNWSDQTLYGARAFPYVATTGVGGGHATISSGSDYWGAMHDPFDTQFILDTRAAAQALAGRVADDPWCLGIFVDNELSWGSDGDDKTRYGLALSALASTPLASPAKRVFLKELKARYADIGTLNQAWRTRLNSWQELDAPYRPAGAFTTAFRGDLSAFTTTFATRYFTVVKAELKKVLPDLLYFGCRFAARTPEAVKAAATVCDVVSFNVYSTGLDAQSWSFAEGLGKPCIVGEFHFGSLDRGMFHTGLVAATDQNDRARMYKEFVGSVLDNPSFVGCHWFQYVDEPLTGRSYDGENYNIGFVNVTDTPYPELVKAAREANGEAYVRRAGALFLHTAPGM